MERYKQDLITFFLMYDNNIKRSAFFWNALSSMMNSFQTMILLFIITKSGDMNDSSIFVMAYAVGNLMLNIGKYGVRQFQVTDIIEKYSYLDYFRARKVSIFFMAIFTVFYLLVGKTIKDYSNEKIFVVLLICVLKGIEAYEDVYHGRMQQCGRLDVAGRILTIRLFVFIVGFIIIYVLSHNLLLTCAINVGISFLLFLILNFLVIDNFKSYITAQKTHWHRILFECFPLCMCMCLNMYICNAPKYIIDTVVSDDVQTCFNIIYMPVFIIALLGNFIFQPLVKGVGELWENRNVVHLITQTVKLSFLVIVSDIIITIIGSLIGCQIMGWLYSVNLMSYRKLLTIFLIVGGIIALQNLFIIIMTTMRCQQYMIYGYSVVALILFAIGKYILLQYHLMGLCYFFLIMLCILSIYSVLIIIIKLRAR